MKDLRSKNENITMGLANEDESESEEEERIEEPVELKDFYTKKYKKKEEKTLLRSKTQKITSIKNGL